MAKIFISGINSGIGSFLAKQYLDDGHEVYGTYRKSLDNNLKRKLTEAYCCDFSHRDDVDQLVSRLKTDKFFSWDIFISSVGTLAPVGNFSELDFDEWEQSLYVNAISQLRLLRGILDSRGEMATVIFFAGGGTNNAFPNYSCYCASKILLIKMCELLDDEIKDLKTVIAGPGMIGTRIHETTLQNPEKAGDNYVKTTSFLKSEKDSDYQTRMERIYRFIGWVVKSDKKAVGGRNFSIVHDLWGGEKLANALEDDGDMYKLRRHKNDLVLEDI